METSLNDNESLLARIQQLEHGTAFLFNANSLINSIDFPFPFRFKFHPLSEKGLMLSSSFFQYFFFKNDFGLQSVMNCVRTLNNCVCNKQDQAILLWLLECIFKGIILFYIRSQDSLLFFGQFIEKLLPLLGQLDWNRRLRI